MINEHSSDAELDEAMLYADFSACYEYCRRRAGDDLAALLNAAEELGAIAYRLECDRPDELLAFKSPDHYERVPLDSVHSLLDPITIGDRTTPADLLRPMPFPALASHTKQAAQSLNRYGVPNPQRSLL